MEDDPYCQEMEDEITFLEMEDNLNNFVNGRQHPSFWKRKMTSIFGNGRQPQFF
jgi:hypothetical protein